MNAVIAQLGRSSPLFSLLMKMKGQLDSKSDANRVYKELMPVLDDLMARGYRFESPEIQGIVNVLRKLPAFGARRNNFERMYLRDEYTLRKLPKDPARIPSGMWH